MIGLTILSYTLRTLPIADTASFRNAPAHHSGEIMRLSRAPQVLNQLTKERLWCQQALTMETRYITLMMLKSAVAHVAHAT